MCRHSSKDKRNSHRARLEDKLSVVKNYTANFLWLKLRKNFQKIFPLPYTSKFSRCTIFTDLLFPNISWKQFSQIMNFEYVHDIVKFCQLNFRRLLGSTKTAKITCLKNLDVYGTRYITVFTYMSMDIRVKQ